MTEYKGEEFRKPYCDALAVPGAVVKCEFLVDGVWRPLHVPSFFTKYTYRFVPTPKRTIEMVAIVNGKEVRKTLVAPEREAPAVGSTWFYVGADGFVAAHTWRVNGLTDYWQSQMLANGNAFLTQEDAQAMADFQKLQRGG